MQKYLVVNQSLIKDFISHFKIKNQSENTKKCLQKF